MRPSEWKLKYFLALQFSSVGPKAKENEKKWYSSSIGYHLKVSLVPTKRYLIWSGFQPSKRRAKRQTRKTMNRRKRWKRKEQLKSRSIKVRIFLPNWIPLLFIFYSSLSLLRLFHETRNLETDSSPLVYAVQKNWRINHFSKASSATNVAITWRMRRALSSICWKFTTSMCMVSLGALNACFSLWSQFCC